MARYFPHDYNARTDRKLARLIHKHGPAGVGIYWCIIEMLYENDGYLMLTDCDCIANEMRTHSETVLEIINTDLFEQDAEKFWSVSALKRLEKINEKSQKAQESAFKRWSNAKAMPTQCEGNAIKQNKIKDIKKINKRKFGEFQNVLLTDDEYQKLLDKLGESNVSRLIESLSEYIASKGKRYKSHYATLLGFARRDGEHKEPYNPAYEKVKC
jgi:hypothetical protein